MSCKAQSYNKLYKLYNVSIGHGVCNIFIYNIVPHNFQFPFSFQDITTVCLILCLHVLNMSGVCVAQR